MTEQNMTTDNNLETIVAEFLAKLDTQASAEESEALEKETDAKLLELANSDEEVFLELRKKAAMMIASSLVGGKLEEKPVESVDAPQ